MERFVIGAALFAAAAIAVGSYFGHVVSDGDGFSFVIDGDEHAGGAETPSKAATAAPQTFAGTSLRVRNAVAVLEVIPEDRTDISVGIVNPGAAPMPTLRLNGSEVIVDGGLGSRRFNCEGSGFNVTLRGVGHLSEAQMPHIAAHVPRNVKLATGGAVKANVGPSTEADLSFSGCGDVTVGDVAGRLSLSSAGSGDTHAGTAQALKISTAGSGDTIVGSVTGKFEGSLAGSGDVEIEKLAGPLDVSIAGSGDVTVAGGVVTDAKIAVAGSGGVTVAAPVQALDVSIAGSGDVTVTGAAQSVKASILGSGDVSVGAVSGSVEKSILGSGSVSIGH